MPTSDGSTFILTVQHWPRTGRYQHDTLYVVAGEPSEFVKRMHAEVARVADSMRAALHA